MKDLIKLHTNEYNNSFNSNSSEDYAESASTQAKKIVNYNENYEGNKKESFKNKEVNYCSSDYESLESNKNKDDPKNNICNKNIRRL